MVMLRSEAGVYNSRYTLNYQGAWLSYVATSVAKNSPAKEREGQQVQAVYHLPAAIPDQI